MKTQTLEKKIYLYGFTLVILMSLTLSWHSVRAEELEASDSKPYTEHLQCTKPQDCKVDLWLTKGYRAFSQCQVCHGLSGEGSTIAPSLVDRLQEIDEARFVEVVTNGYQGQIGVMPGWKENPNVMKYIDQLYAYLLARSDGELQGGKLERYDREPR